MSSVKTWLIDISVCFGFSILTLIALAPHVSFTGTLLLLTVAAWMTIGLYASRRLRKGQQGR